MEQKAVGHLHISIDEINKLFEKSGKAGVADHAEQGDGNDTFIDLYVALVSQPSIGKSLLGEAGWNNLQKTFETWPRSCDGGRRGSLFLERFGLCPRRYL